MSNFFFMAIEYSRIWMYHNLIILNDEHLGWVYFWLLNLGEIIYRV